MRMTITMKGDKVGSAIKLDRKVADREGSVTRIGIEGAVAGVLACLELAWLELQTLLIGYFDQPEPWLGFFI